MLISVNLEQHVTLPTHSPGHTLDLCLCSISENLVVDQPVTTEMISDHEVVSAKLTVIKPKTNKRTRSDICVRATKNINYNLFQEDLK